MTAIQLGYIARRGVDHRGEDPVVFEVDDIDHAVLMAENRSMAQKKAIDSALLMLSAYIPAEALGFYLTATAILDYPKGLGDAIISGVTLGLVMLFVVAGNSAASQAQGSVGKLALALAFALTAACVYLAALPQSFIHEWRPYTTSVGAVVVIGCAILLPTVGSIVKFNPPLR